MKRQSRISQILTRLMNEKGIRATELARRINLPQPTVHRIATGICENPHLSSLKPISDFFAVTVNQLRGLDPIHSIDQILKIPLLTWDDLHVSRLNRKKLMESRPLIFTDANLSHKAFALQVEESHFEPLFSDETILIFDPEKDLKPRSYALIRFAQTNKIYFKQIVFMDKKVCVKPIKPSSSTQDKAMPLKSQDVVLGILIQTKSNYY